MEAEEPEMDFDCGPVEAGDDLCMTLNDFLAVLDGEEPPDAADADRPLAKDIPTSSEAEDGQVSKWHVDEVLQDELLDQCNVESSDYHAGSNGEAHLELAGENKPCVSSYPLATNGSTGSSMGIVDNNLMRMDGHYNWQIEESVLDTEGCGNDIHSEDRVLEMVQMLDSYSRGANIDIPVNGTSCNVFEPGMTVDFSSELPVYNNGINTNGANGGIYNMSHGSVRDIGDSTALNFGEVASHTLPEELPQQIWSDQMGSEFNMIGPMGECVSSQFASNNDMMQHEEIEEEDFGDASLSECLDSDFDTSSLCSLSDDKSQQEDVCFKSESSIDSSPLPSTLNSTNGEIDRVLDSTMGQLKHDFYNVFNNGAAITKDKRGNLLLPANHAVVNHPKLNTAVFLQKFATNCISLDDDGDAGAAFIHESSNFTRNAVLPFHQKNDFLFHRPMFSNPLPPLAPQTGVMRYKPHDEQLTYQLALEGLSQPSSEASPPDGVLSVPLLKHQRMALYWMIQRETSSLNCSGGILADDQGLGKTVSAISLILMERRPAPSHNATKKCAAVTLDVDDDNEEGTLDDDAPECGMRKHPRLCSSEAVSSPKGETPPVEMKTRPAAGTLVVCPTSVLRQWAEELQYKVTRQAKLSFLVYHGSNRTKDPDEVAKYDVVLTTYAIVSMEVPKQPILEEDEENGKQENNGGSGESVLGKKRKSKNLKEKKIESLIESVLRPLARVSWFRVILDEAQSIKNYRTQVARACWGLRAKRRWCLSGTPIQNAVDDLYSYFRFLRYDPYAVYKSFVQMIKMPISKNPANGYKKLQAVLKTVMLRRTKDTLLDGKPIINLPPKTIILKKVEFSDEERSFYSKLEAESREQFQEYEAAGTVKQNYVNILLMLLRLRQACDHPVLAKGYKSTSSWRCTLEAAKKLPREKQQKLLFCLHSYSAVCAICNDVPEDAVVTICEHVFCNQCISEHLTGGDDSICPTTACKTRLKSTSLFSRGTLECCLNGVSGEEPNDFPNSEILLNSSFESSKVKAAIQILLSLPKLDHSKEVKTEKTSKEVKIEPTTMLSSPLEEQEEKKVVSNGSLRIRLPNFAVKTEQKVKLEEVEEKVFSSGNSHNRFTEKAIVFSQWTTMLDLMEVHLKGTSIQYRRLDGTMSIAARDKAVKEFKTMPEVTVIIMSLKAASLGLNMVAACHVLLLDLWWNPTTEDQAIDRAHRIGQTRPVTVSRLTVNNTVEDRIIALQEKKRELVSSAFGEDKSGTRQSRLTVEDLHYLFNSQQL